MRRDEGTCQACLAAGRLAVATDVDHKVNKAQWRRTHGGSLDGVDDPENLQALCRSCHQLKSAREGARGRGGWSKV